MNRSQTHAKYMNTLEQKAFWTLLGLIGLFMALHVYFVVSGIVYTSDRQHIMNSLSTVRSDVGELESSYLALSKDIDLSFAYDSGFEKAQNIVFAKHTTLVSHAGNTDNEI